MTGTFSGIPPADAVVDPNLGEWNWNPSFQWTQPFQYLETREERLARRFYSEHLERGGKPSAKTARRCWKAARSFYEVEQQ